MNVDRYDALVAGGLLLLGASAYLWGGIEAILAGLGLACLAVGIYGAQNNAKRRGRG